MPASTGPGRGGLTDFYLGALNLVKADSLTWVHMRSFTTYILCDLGPPASLSPTNLTQACLTQTTEKLKQENAVEAPGVLSVINVRFPSWECCREPGASNSQTGQVTICLPVICFDRSG